MLTFCTLFDENYIDKGIVLYKSLEKVTKDFVLHILCMSDRCYEILVDLNLPHLHPVSLSEFENEELLKVKPIRSVAEYCWTCSSSLTKYIMETYNPPYCSYIDADMRFYANPTVIIEEMERRGASVSIVGHRFNKKKAAKRVPIVGKYCVECNTFKNDTNGRSLLNKWVDQCLEHCSIDGDGIHWADQKYMDNWVDDYPFVIETDNLGAGVAPWNIAQYRLVDSKDGRIRIKCNKQEYTLLFYHFAGIAYVSDGVARINVYNQWGVQDKLVSLLYDQYLAEIEEIKGTLRNQYNIFNILKSHPGLTVIAKNPFHKQIKNFLKSLISFNLDNYSSDIPRFVFKKKDYRQIR